MNFLHKIIQIVKTMDLITKPSFSTCYYIRKLLLQHTNELKSIISQKVGFCVNSQAILEQLLHNVYLEDTLVELLKSLYLEEAEISVEVHQLENLILRHQNTVANNPFDYQELGALEWQVF